MVSLLLASSFVDILTYIGYIVLAVCILLLMITIHELGHYTAGYEHTGMFATVP